MNKNAFFKPFPVLRTLTKSSMFPWRDEKKPNQESDVDDVGATVIGSGSKLGTKITGECFCIYSCRFD